MIDTRWLKRQGIDRKSIHDYVARGWLERVVRGVYRRPLPENVSQTPETAWQIPLLSLQWIMDQRVHLGGQSALELRGHVHYLSLGSQERVYLYGDVPSWLNRLPTKTNFVVRRRTLFGDDLTGLEESDHDAETAGQTDTTRSSAINVWRWPIKASSPERAILEALDELPNHASFHNLDMIFEGLATLRPKQLTALLSACRSVKVRRLFFVFADRHQPAWRKHIDMSKVDFGSGPRALVEGGKLHPTYRIYVPADLVPVLDEREDVDA